MIYLDSAASTRVAPEVCAAMLAHLDGTAGFANPSSGPHEPGLRAADAVERAHADVAAALRCAAAEIIFTGSATESNNLHIVRRRAARHA
ncbi:MAG: aminotransferase class V-fold PLP-dependent enzyme [Gammaproteobacteria bacterium]|nr:aminotransferase class V-fold PLP-dependent enzyme [Gammaproteobacteria bacterium]